MPVDWYDSWKLNPPEPKIACRCDHCEEDIYEGEEIYTLCDGTKVHTSCFEDYAKYALDARLEFAK